MKSVLAEWYGPNDEEIGEFLANATIALDANVLLALYRVNDAQRKQVLDVLTRVSSRLWVPHQAALEYQRNRLGVAADQQKAHDAVASIASERVTEVLSTAVTTLTELCAEAVGEVRDREIRSAIEEQFTMTVSSLEAVLTERQLAMQNKFHELRRTHTIDFADARNADPIRAALDALITDDRVGEKPDAETLETRKKKAQTRIDAKIPPGYKDANKDDATGDCLIWFELLDHARKSTRPILFVTDDAKEDSYQRVRGQIVGPRVELRAEMANEAKQPYHQTTLDGFVRLANRHLKTAVPEDTIATLERSRVEANRAGREVRGRLRDIRMIMHPDGFMTPAGLVEVLGDGYRSGESLLISLTNPATIAALGVLIGDVVVVRIDKEGMYEILGPVLDVRTGEEREFTMPERCPACETPVVVSATPKGRPGWRCPNEECAPKRQRDQLED
ncbi:PIN-like domain-containing protein [Rhodococcus sp. USK13]|uniref:PIN-like domain-containing protein n=1 Tax=Rhodococcus sp. USK13 TaxID=2806442 RepID=UPI001BD051BD|nr:PIN-like domain-containing protein [Rhodococcus sp. USK13]